ncbi:hypothetical protein [Citrobacter portucalensis]|uniref:hypothetical protein n=1 Tax=Citrobacter portucalensis TaxID=1639133 RepID=UPI002B235802|nr:hypothetical protein [Citrobacter portucalensis]MEB0900795.1 hypothetical protein [Citrobacter portucalensis]
MKIYSRATVLFFFTFVLSGCVGDYKIKRAVDVSDAGAKYTEDVQTLLILEQAEYSRLIVRLLAEQSRTETRYYSAYKHALNNRDEIKSAVEMVDVLNEYFLVLGKLAKDDSKDTAATLSSITDTLKSENIGLSIGDSLSNAIPKIGASGAVAYRGHLIGKAFERDGDLIMLSIRSIRGFLNSERMKFNYLIYKNNMFGRYQVSKYVSTPENQLIDRDLESDFVRQTSISTTETAFRDAIDASLAMEIAWIKTANGKMTTDEFLTSLDRFSSTVKALSQTRN